MRTGAVVSRMSISQLNPNDVEGAALALAALEITQPELAEENDIDYWDKVTAIMEEYCPLFRVPEEIRTPEENEAANAMQDAIQSKANEVLAKLRSSKDPLFRALAGRQRTATR